MNKTEFLDELKNGLAVLEEKEQQDILEEYTQHIDMKMERGLSEEEAIGDFGDLGQLAAEILEAYHVNPDYNGNRTLSPVLRVRDLIRRARSGFLGIARAAGRFLHRIAAAAVRNTGVLFGRTRNFFSRILPPSSQDKDGGCKYKQCRLHTIIRTLPDRRSQDTACSKDRPCP